MILMSSGAAGAWADYGDEKLQDSVGRGPSPGVRMPNSHHRGNHDDQDKRHDDERDNVGECGSESEKYPTPLHRAPSVLSEDPSNGVKGPATARVVYEYAAGTCPDTTRSGEREPVVRR